MRRKITTSKAAVWAISLILVLTAAIGGTSALLLAKSTSLTNTFTESHVSTKVNETIDGNTKKNVTVQNTGNTSAYIRAAVVITWKNAAGDAGSVYGKEPEAGVDYVIDYGSGWQLAADGFYYWTQPVAAGNSTGNLINYCAPTSTPIAPDGYYLNVEIIASGIQSNPASTAAHIWQSGIQSVSEGGALTVKPYTGG